MIYSNPLNESNIILKGLDADSFLESYGITLFNDAIAIGEMVMDGITGQNILIKNGITLNEDHIVLEGEQAEEYKARKAKEVEDKKNAEKEHHKNRYYYEDGDDGKIGNKFAHHPDRKDILKNAYTRKDPGGQNYEKTIGEDRRRTSKAYDKANNLVYSGKVPIHDPKVQIAADSINRNMRRHPKQYAESTIFRYVDLIAE